MNAEKNDKKYQDTVREKLRHFLYNGDPEDVASVLVHTLMQRADVAEEFTKLKKQTENK